MSYMKSFGFPFLFYQWKGTKYSFISRGYHNYKATFTMTIPKYILGNVCLMVTLFLKQSFVRGLIKQEHFPISDSTMKGLAQICTVNLLESEIVNLYKMSVGIYKKLHKVAERICADFN